MVTAVLSRRAAQLLQEKPVEEHLGAYDTLTVLLLRLLLLLFIKWYNYYSITSYGSTKSFRSLKVRLPL